MHLAQLNAHGSAAAGPQGQESTHPWRLQIIILTQQSQTCFVPSTQSYFPQVFVLQWHIVTACSFRNHFVSSDSKNTQDLWRKGIEKGSITWVSPSDKHQASCWTCACYHCWWHKLFKYVYLDVYVQLMASNKLPQRTSFIVHLSVSHLSSEWVSFTIQPSRGSQTNAW